MAQSKVFLVMSKIAIENGPVDIVSFPSCKTLDLAIAVSFYRRVRPIKPHSSTMKNHTFSTIFPCLFSWFSHKTTIFLWFSHGFPIKSLFSYGFPIIFPWFTSTSIPSTGAHPAVAPGLKGTGAFTFDQSVNTDLNGRKKSTAFDMEIGMFFIWLVDPYMVSIWIFYGYIYYRW